MTWDACQSNTCVGYGAVFRITFALAVYFLVHALLVCLPLCYRIDRLSWFWHYLVFVGLLVACWAIPSVFYDEAWVNIARFLSVPFLFFQIVILIDFAYEWNASWTRDDRHKCYLVLVVIVSVLLIAGALTLCGLYFWWYADSDCKRNQFFVSWTIIEIVVLTVLAISPWIAEGTGGLLPAGVISLYLAWLAYSGLDSDPSSCNTVQKRDTLHLVLGLVIGALSLVYAAYNVSTNNTLFGGEDLQPSSEAASDSGSGSIGGDKPPPVPPRPGNGDIEMASPAAQSMDANGNGTAHTASATDLASSPSVTAAEAQLLARRNLRFHALMLCCSTYMCMLLTNWGSSQQASDGSTSSQSAYDQGVESVFIKFASQWLCFFVFLWSLFAPKIMTSREFHIN